MEIRTFGNEERTLVCAGLLKEALGEGRVGRLIVLPIPTSVDEKNIKGTDVSLGEIAALTDENTAVIGYDIPGEITQRGEKVGAKLFDASLDEDFLLENAELTARGTVGYILTNSKLDASDMRIGIVGYGRIGKRILRLLLFLGAKIMLYTTRKEVALSMCQTGVPACVIDENCDFSGLDILINTAPARQIDEEKLDKETLIIDLASGNVFDRKEGVVKLSSVPTKYYPVSAGKVYAKAAYKALFGGEL